MKSAFIINPAAPMVDLLNHARFISSRIEALTVYLTPESLDDNGGPSAETRSQVYATIGYLSEQQAAIIDRLFQLRPSDEAGRARK